MPASEIPWTRDRWVYDLRTNIHFTLKAHPLARDDSLDDGENLPPPEVLAAEIAEDLEAALSHFCDRRDALDPSAAGSGGF